MQPSPEDSQAAQDAGGDGFQLIHIAGFCSLKDVVLEPGRLTLLIGPNGAGKSNLLQALRLIPLLRTRSLQSYVADHGFGAALLHYGPKTTDAIEIGVLISDQGSSRSDGSNLAAYLLRLKESDQDADRKAWQRINRHCRHIAPAIKELDPVAVNGSVRLDWIDDCDQRFGCHQLSDGTLRALALITVLSQPAERLPRLISIDEPELGLHPAAIALIAELCRSICRQTQIILSTQSTELLDHFRVDEVVVVERAQGETILKRLSEQDLRLWLQDYSLCELYAKGVIGGTP